MAIFNSYVSHNQAGYPMLCPWSCIEFSAATRLHGRPESGRIALHDRGALPEDPHRRGDSARTGRAELKRAEKWEHIYIYLYIDNIIICSYMILYIYIICPCICICNYMYNYVYITYSIVIVIVNCFCYYYYYCYFLTMIYIYIDI